MAPAARLRIDRFHGTKQEWDEFAAEEEPATFYHLADSAEFLSPRTFCPKPRSQIGHPPKEGLDASPDADVRSFHVHCPTGRLQYRPLQ